MMASQKRAVSARDEPFNAFVSGALATAAYEHADPRLAEGGSPKRALNFFAK